MGEQVALQVGGVTLLLRHADAASAAAQLAQAGYSAEVASVDGPLIIGDDHPLWSMHSGGKRHEGPEWGPDDVDLAQTQAQLPPLTSIFHRTLVEHPEQLLSVRTWPGSRKGACPALESQPGPCPVTASGVIR